MRSLLKDKKAFQLLNQQVAGNITGTFHPRYLSGLRTCLVIPKPTLQQTSAFFKKVSASQPRQGLRPSFLWRFKDLRLVLILRLSSSKGSEQNYLTNPLSWGSQGFAPWMSYTIFHLYTFITQTNWVTLSGNIGLRATQLRLMCVYLFSLIYPQDQPIVILFSPRFIFNFMFS